ncbi:hypothetical protein GCM10025762_39570 [Haloechinothrix salitolerans]
MGIVAALWAALLGAFLATKHRKAAEQAWHSVADAQHIYELELEREITARREYELELEASTRRRVEQETHSEIQDLRTEVMALRDSLQQLLEGDVVYERVALTEQSTRRRSMREEQNGVASGEGRSGPRLVSGTKTALEEVADQRTQVISRVVTSSAPRLRRAGQHVVDEPRYEPYPGEPRQATGYEAFPAEPAPEPNPYEPVSSAEPEQARYYRAELPTGDQPDDGLSLPEHQSASEFSLADYTNGGNGTGGSAAARKYEFPAFSLFEDSAQESFDAFGGSAAGDGAFTANGHGTNGGYQPPQQWPSAPQPPKRPHNDGSDTGDLSAVIAANQGNHAASQQGAHSADHGGASDHRGGWARPAQTQQPQQEHSWFTPTSPVTPTENGHAGGAHRETPPATNHSLPPGALEIQRQGKPGGRRRKPDPDDAAMASAGSSEPVVPETPTVRAASRPEPAPRAPMREESTGSHASGRSVHDLLAAHGRSTPARRHRYKD